MKRMLCTDCGGIGEPIKITKGKLSTEIVLWMFLLLPGMFYSAWRHGSRYQGCALCKGSNIIPLTSPIAQKFVKDNLGGIVPPPPESAAYRAGSAIARWLTTPSKQKPKDSPAQSRRTVAEPIASRPTPEPEPETIRAIFANTPQHQNNHRRCNNPDCHRLLGPTDLVCRHCKTPVSQE